MWYYSNLVKLMLQLVGVLMASGDALSQFVVERKSLLQYDAYRTSRFFLFGTFLLVRVAFVLTTCCSYICDVINYLYDSI